MNDDYTHLTPLVTSVQVRSGNTRQDRLAHHDRTPPVRFAYADPPYLGKGASMYGAHHPSAAVWDDKATHLALMQRLVTDYPDGWALSCLPRDLVWQLPAAPPDVRVAAWVKPWHQIRPTSVQYAWEAVLWRGGRLNPKRNPMVRDWHQESATRMRGVPGAKPLSFNAWILALLGYDPDLDECDDLFPGSGGMGLAQAIPPLPFGDIQEVGAP